MFSMAHMGERRGECFNFSHLFLVCYGIKLYIVGLP